MDLRRFIDATILRSDASIEEVVEFAKKSAQEGFRSVVVHPFFVKYVSNLAIPVCTVVGFPYGTQVKEVKAFEAKKAAEDGASEIDYVVSLPSLKSRMVDYLRQEATLLRQSFPGVIKAIIEIPILSDEELEIIVSTLDKTEIDYVKTSTGLYRPVTPEDIRKIGKYTNKGVKAAGGIRKRDQAEELIKAGASILGTSKPFNLLK